MYSSTLDQDALLDVHVVATGPVAHVRELKAGDGGGIWLCGGGRLAATLAGEIDRLVIKLNPVTVGQGRSLVDGPFALVEWRLVSSRTYDLGVVLLEYARVSAAGS